MFALRGNGVKAVQRGLFFRPSPRPPFLSTGVISRPLSTPSLFNKNHDQRQQDGVVSDKIENKKNGKPARNTSLRRVGLEAERSRVIVRNKGGVRILERGVETKVRPPELKITGDSDTLVLTRFLESCRILRS
jgi:hypothetical protein